MFLRFWEECSGFDGNFELPGYGPWVDGKLLGYAQDNCKIDLLWKESTPIGFVIYNKIFNCVVVGRAIYIEKKYRGIAMLRKLIAACEPFTRCIAQEFKSRPVAGFIKAKNRTKIYEDEDMIVFEYKWGKHGS